jgi:hypothetical protein
MPERLFFFLSHADIATIKLNSLRRKASLLVGLGIGWRRHHHRRLDDDGGRDGRWRRTRRRTRDRRLGERLRLGHPGEALTGLAEAHLGRLLRSRWK